MNARWWGIVAVAILAGAGLLVYSNSFTVPFIYDDKPAITDNPFVGTLWPISKALSPAPGAGLEHRPVVSLSFAINCALTGCRESGFHVVNLVIHLLAGLALFGVVRRTLLTRGLRESLGPYAAPLALAVALLWLVHPLQTESVTCIIQRIESLMGLFFLLTLYCTIRGAEPGRRAWLVAAVASCALGMATKERMVVAPLIVLLYDRTFLAGSFAEALRRRRGFYIALGSTWGVLAGLMLLEPLPPAIGMNFGLSPLGYARFQVPVVLHYLQLAFWPHPLVLYCSYSVRDGQTIIPTLGDIALPLVILSALLALTVFAMVRRPRWGFLGAWFFLILAPSSSFVPIGEPSEDHHMYLPLACVVAAAVVAVYFAGRIALKWLVSSERARLAVGWSAASALTLVGAGTLGYVSWTRNLDYQNELTLWEKTVKERPESPRARLNYAAALKEADRLDAGVAQCEEAVRLFPSYVDGHFNLGMGYGEQGRFEEAAKEFVFVLKAEPYDVQAVTQLVEMRLRQGRPDLVMEAAEMALQIDPRVASEHRQNLPAVLSRLAWQFATHPDAKFRNGAEAVKLAERACGLVRNRSALLLDALAAAYAEAGRWPDAVATAQKAVEAATAAGQGDLAEQIGERLKSYESGRPWRQPSHP